VAQEQFEEWANRLVAEAELAIADLHRATSLLLAAKELSGHPLFGWKVGERLTQLRRQAASPQTAPGYVRCTVDQVIVSGPVDACCWDCVERSSQGHVRRVETGRAIFQGSLVGVDVRRQVRVPCCKKCMTARAGARLPLTALLGRLWRRGTAQGRREEAYPPMQRTLAAGYRKLELPQQTADIRISLCADREIGPEDEDPQGLAFLVDRETCWFCGKGPGLLEAALAVHIRSTAPSRSGITQRPGLARPGGRQGSDLGLVTAVRVPRCRLCREARAGEDSSDSQRAFAYPVVRKLCNASAGLGFNTQLWAGTTDGPAPHLR